MRKRIYNFAALIAVFELCSITSLSNATAQEVPADYQDVLKTLDKKGDYKSNVLKLNIPRNDLKVTIDGISTPTPFGFGGWLAMTKGDGGNDVTMGDIVLLEDVLHARSWTRQGGGPRQESQARGRCDRTFFAKSRGGAGEREIKCYERADARGEDCRHRWT